MDDKERELYESFRVVTKGEEPLNPTTKNGWTQVTGVFAKYEVMFNESQQRCIIRFNSLPIIDHDKRIEFMAKDVEDAIRKTVMVMLPLETKVFGMLHGNQELRDELWEEVKKFERHAVAQTR